MSSPSLHVGTSPAGGRSVSTGVPACASSQAVPTSGWPASGSSTVGVWIAARRSRGRRRTRSRSTEVGGDGLAVGGGAIAAAVEHDAERVAALPAGAEEHAEGVEGRSGSRREDGARECSHQRQERGGSVKLCCMLDPRRLLILDAVAAPAR